MSEVVQKIQDISQTLSLPVSDDHTDLVSRLSDLEGEVHAYIYVTWYTKQGEINPTLLVLVFG